MNVTTTADTSEVGNSADHAKDQQYPSSREVMPERWRMNSHWI